MQQLESGFVQFSEEVKMDFECIAMELTIRRGTPIIDYCTADINYFYLN